MSKGWTVKVEVPVRFSMDCNVGVLGSNEDLAIAQAKEFVLKHLELGKDWLPWDFEVAGLSFARGGETLSFESENFQYIVEPDPDFDPDEDDEEEFAEEFVVFMRTGQVLNEAFWHLSTFHPLMLWKDEHGVNKVRDNLSLCAIYCTKMYALACCEDEDQGPMNVDFARQFLERCVNDEFMPRSENEKVLYLLWRGI